MEYSISNMRWKLYQNPVAMVDLVLDYFSRPAGESLEPGLKFFILPLNLDSPEAPSLSAPCKGVTALLGFICPGLLHDDGVEHDLIRPLVVENNDALVYPDHIRRHAHAAVLVGGEGVDEVLGDGEVIGGGWFGFLGEKTFVFANFLDHAVSPCMLLMLPTPAASSAPPRTPGAARGAPGPWGSG